MRTRAKPGPVPRLLAVDNAIYVPVNKVVRVQVIRFRRHSRLDRAVFRREDRRHPRPPERDLVQGDARGRLLRPVLGAVGKDHAFMPIEVRVVSEQAYATWLADAKKKFAMDSSAPASAVASASGAKSE